MILESAILYVKPELQEQFEKQLAGLLFKNNYTRMTFLEFSWYCFTLSVEISKLVCINKNQGDCVESCV